MTDLIKTLNKKNLVAYIQHELLLHNFGGFANEIFKNPLKNSQVQSQQERYHSM